MDTQNMARMADEDELTYRGTLILVSIVALGIMAVTTAMFFLIQ